MLSSSEIQEKTLPLTSVNVLDITPTLSDPVWARRVFDPSLRGDTKAVILNTYASGSLPDAVTPLIKECTDKGMSVFIVSGNYGSDRGIQEVGYDSLMKPVKAGAIPIRNVNVRGLSEVAQTVQRTINGGLLGKKLNEVIINKFGTVPEAMLQK